MKSLLLAIGFAGLAGVAFGANPPPAQPAHIVLKPADFQKTIDGKPVSLYMIRNRNGVSVALTNYGARIEQILVPDRHGKLGDIAQGYATIDGVMQGEASMGAFIGRYANRIGKGQFTLEGKSYQLAINDLSTPPAPPRQNTLHGGKKGSRFVVFDARQLSPSSVEMDYVFKDGEENFPGTLPVRVVYTLGNDNTLTIAWASAANDKTTVANYTQHTFFNLSGDLGSSIYDQVLYLNADKVLESDETLVPDGKVIPVAGTVQDFTKAKPIGRDIEQKVPALIGAGGFDFSYVIDGWRGQRASLTWPARQRPEVGPRAGSVDDEPGVQFYSGNFLEGKCAARRRQGQYGVPFRSAFCLEASHFPERSTIRSSRARPQPGQWDSRENRL